MLQSCYKIKGQPEKLCFSSNNSIKLSVIMQKRYFMLIILRLSSENS